MNSEGDVLTAVTFNLAQWSKKEQTATLETSADGTNFTKTTVTSTNFTLSSASLGEGVVAARVSFSSNKNQVGIKSIVIEYSAANSDKDLADLKFSESQVNVVLGGEFTAPTLTKATTAEVTYSSSDAAVAEVDATTGAVTIMGVGMAIITAKAEENDKFNAGSASYTIVVEKRIATIADLLELYGDTAKGQESESFIVGFEPVVIYNSNGYVYIYDGEDYALIYAYNQAVSAGDKIAAGWTATLKNYNNLFEIIPAGTLEADGSADIPAPVKITDLATQLVAANQNMYVALDNVVFDAATTDETASGSARGYTGTVDGTTVNFFNNFKSASVEAGKYDVIGFITVYNTTVQVAPVSFEKVTTEIESIALDSNAPAEYYNLQGIRVSGDEPGLYIVRQGDKVAKVLVK
ncbi:MAG: DUF5689 domain-containing protein [Pseudoflavonifractor sp.]|nr:DUF5689 domain-containing protein [Pseudoflavonifractor sp.]